MGHGRVGKHRKHPSTLRIDRPALIFNFSLKVVEVMPEDNTTTES